MLKAMKLALETNKMFEPGEKILVACSGGPDSWLFCMVFAVLVPKWDLR